MKKQEILYPICGRLLTKQIPDHQVIVAVAKRENGKWIGVNKEPENYDSRVLYNVGHLKPNNNECNASFHLFLKSYFSQIKGDQEEDDK